MLYRITNCFLTVPENDDNTREAQDTPVISVESNRNKTDTVEPAKPKKVAKVPKSNKIADGSTTPSADDVTTEVNPTGESFFNSFPFFHFTDFLIFSFPNV